MGQEVGLDSVLASRRLDCGRVTDFVVETVVLFYRYFIQQAGQDCSPESNSNKANQTSHNQKYK